MKIIAAQEHQSPAEGQQTIIAPANDADPFTLDLTGVQRIDLNFPKFTDGRAFSQARLLRKRLGFQGEIRATGDVLIDQLVQRSEEHTSELQSRPHLVCRLLLENKKTKYS